MHPPAFGEERERERERETEGEREIEREQPPSRCGTGSVPASVGKGAFEWMVRGVRFMHDANIKNSRDPSELREKEWEGTSTTSHVVWLATLCWRLGFSASISSLGPVTLEA